MKEKWLLCSVRLSRISPPCCASKLTLSIFLPKDLMSQSRCGCAVWIGWDHNTVINALCVCERERHGWQPSETQVPCVHCRRAVTSGLFLVASLRNACSIARRNCGQPWPTGTHPVIIADSSQAVKEFSHSEPRLSQNNKQGYKGEKKVGVGVGLQGITGDNNTEPSIGNRIGGIGLIPRHFSVCIYRTRPFQFILSQACIHISHSHLVQACTQTQGYFLPVTNIFLSPPNTLSLSLVF